MSFINGVELASVKHLKEPEKLLNRILDFIYLSFKNHDIIHSDLSEFNIMITDKLELLIIDFPQWISSKHPQYIYYLKRDIINVLEFFRKKFQIHKDINKIMLEYNL